MEGLLKYLDEQIDAVREHATAALEAFDEKAVHQARVATRRIKAGLELLDPLLAKSAKNMGRAGRKLRRRLGPLRDLDVMIGLVAEGSKTDSIAPAIDWLGTTLQNQRRDARLADHRGGSKPSKLLGRFDSWWKLRHELQANLDAIEPLLTEALHTRFAGFAQQADLISGITQPAEDAPHIDVHQVRIEGKALRYTLEMAEAAGVKLPKKMIRLFKAMQQSLGDWHDHVVLYERTLSLIVDEELALHEPQLAGTTLDLARSYLNRSIKSLNGFKQQWTKSGGELKAALDEHVPLVVEPDTDAARPAEESAGETTAETPVVEPQEDISALEDAIVEPSDEDFSESETDLDPQPTDSIESSDNPSPDVVQEPPG